MITSKRLITIPETCARTALGRTALYARIQSGELRPVKLGRKTVFLEEEVTDWINQRLNERGAR